ncbi:MAG: DUF3899 domain-containing protein [Acholeplasmatales bacterium]|nr:DUF3899 domain-containing protein [Acholeplasmatales bacterium]
MTNKKVIVGVIIKYSVAIIVATGLLFMALGLRNYFSVEDNKEKIKMLSDGFTIPGVFLCLLGVLVWISNQGAFTGVSYLVKRMFTALLPRFRKEETYAEYRENRKKYSGYLFLFIVGGAFLITGIVLAIVYMNI